MSKLSLVKVWLGLIHGVEGSTCATAAVSEECGWSALSCGASAVQPSLHMRNLDTTLSVEPFAVSKAMVSQSRWRHSHLLPLPKIDGPLMPVRGRSDGEVGSLAPSLFVRNQGDYTTPAPSFACPTPMLQIACRASGP